MPKTAKRPAVSKLSFEQAVTELEQLVAEMEAGDIPLDDALAHFERGVALSRHSQKLLQAADQRVQVLQQTGSSEPELKTFEVDSANTASA